MDFVSGSLLRTRVKANSPMFSFSDCAEYLSSMSFSLFSSFSLFILASCASISEISSSTFWPSGSVMPFASWRAASSRPILFQTRSTTPRILLISWVFSSRSLKIYGAFGCLGLPPSFFGWASFLTYKTPSWLPVGVLGGRPLFFCPRA